jgi:hypothetical protein
MSATPLVVAGATAVPLLIAAAIEQPIWAVIYAITVGISLWLFWDSRRRGQSVLVATGWAVGGVVVPGIVHAGYLYRHRGERSATPRRADEE